MRNNTAKDYAVALYDLTKGLTGAPLNKTIHDFVALLSRKGSLKKGEKIIEEFIKYSKKQSGVIDIEITSARKLSEKNLEQIKKQFGKHVEAVEKVDPTLIGGIKVKTENSIFDGSLQKQLQLLRNQIN